MTLENHKEYAMCEYIQKPSISDDYKLGDVVIKGGDEIGVIIQAHGNNEYRTDMFGNCYNGELELATYRQILLYRNNILKENTFKN